MLFKLRMIFAVFCLTDSRLLSGRRVHRGSIQVKIFDILTLSFRVSITQKPTYDYFYRICCCPFELELNFNFLSILVQVYFIKFIVGVNAIKNKILKILQLTWVFLFMFGRNMLHLKVFFFKKNVWIMRLNTDINWIVGRNFTKKGHFCFVKKNIDPNWE